MLDADEIRDEIQITTLHQVRVLDGVLQTVRRRLEEEMPLDQFGHLVCTLTELEGQLLQWTHALMHWVEGDPDAVPDPEDD